MYLHRGKRIHKYHWEELPKDKDFINRVEEMENRENQHLLPYRQHIVEWAPGITIDNEHNNDKGEERT